MPVLRSRKIPPFPNPQSSPKTLEINGFIEPSTPSKTIQSLANSTNSSPNSVDFEPNLTSMSAPPVRRSNRLASKPTSEENSPGLGSDFTAKRRRRESVGKTMQFHLEDDEVKNVNCFDGLGLCSVDENIVRVSDCDSIVEECLKKLKREDFDCSEEENGWTKVAKNLGDEREIGSSKEGMEKGILIEEGGGFENEAMMGENGCLSLRSGTKVVKNLSNEREIDTGKGGKGKGKLIGEGGGFENEGKMEENGCLNLRSGTKVVKNLSNERENDTGKEGKGKGKDILIEEDGDCENEGKMEGNSAFDFMSAMEKFKNVLEECGYFAGNGKGKGKAVLNKEDDDFENGGLKSSRRRFSREEKGKGVNSGRFSREEKGKGVKSESDCELDDKELDLAVQLSMVGSEMEGLVNEMDDDVHENVVFEERTKNLRAQHKYIARRNASRYAFFNVREEEENNVNDDDDEMEAEEPVGNVEDWPGPFSTAMKIIRDREKNSNRQARDSSSVKEGFPLVSWTPRKEREPECRNREAPSLISLCLNVLAENVDAITSLDSVPDALRNKLSRLLCDSRKMNPHFLSLLLDGSPSEIRLSDCSWLEERVFEKLFEACDLKIMTVLQLDLCGHCVSDSSLRKALVPKGLEALTTISLKGGCRISDAGLAALVSSAPALRSMNLSQCSLLTDVGIGSIANSLGLVLQELYLDDCETLDAMRILPKLQQLKALEVLSLRGIVSVSDKFIKKLFEDNGQNMKELILANCVNLTDSSLKVIANTCSQLRVLDLSYLGKLSDIGMAYITNGCRSIQDLKLCRSPFSDDAIAAFLETSGESLTELSLNNISKVGQNTTISLARRCKNLESLDLSWCRLLTNEALGLIADSCSSLRLLKLFGCTQVTEVFVSGHSNQHLHIVGLKLTPILEHIKRPDFQQGPLHYSTFTPY